MEIFWRLGGEERNELRTARAWLEIFIWWAERSYNGTIRPRSGSFVLSDGCGEEKSAQFAQSLEVLHCLVGVEKRNELSSPKVRESSGSEWAEGREKSSESPKAKRLAWSGGRRGVK